MKARSYNLVIYNEDGEKVYEMKKLWFLDKYWLNIFINQLIHDRNDIIRYQTNYKLEKIKFTHRLFGWEEPT